MAQSHPYEFNLASEWHLGAPPQAIWRLLEKPLEWPRWWPYLRHVEKINGGERDCYRFIWRGKLRYPLALTMRMSIAEPPWLLVGAASGDLVGMGRWELDAMPLGTRVRYHWCVKPQSRPLRRLVPVLAPLFAWDHHRVMRAGAHGMARQLGVDLFDYWRRA